MILSTTLVMAEEITPSLIMDISMIYLFTLKLLWVLRDILYKIFRYLQD